MLRSFSKWQAISIKTKNFCRTLLTLSWLLTRCLPNDFRTLWNCQTFPKMLIFDRLGWNKLKFVSLLVVSSLKNRQRLVIGFLVRYAGTFRHLINVNYAHFVIYDIFAVTRRMWIGAITVKILISPHTETRAAIGNATKMSILRAFWLSSKS